MRPLSELPYRFWPKNQLPEGVAARDTWDNQKASEFKKAYTKVVNPRLKAAGFKCAGTIARRQGPWLAESTWFLCARGLGELVIGAHPPDFPRRGGYELKAGESFDYASCVFKRVMDLCPNATTEYGRGHRMLDLGRNLEEGLETAQVFAELFEAQGLPYLAELATAREQLLAIDAASFDSRQDVVTRLGVCVGVGGGNERGEVLLLLARLRFQAGDLAGAKSLCELGLAGAPHARLASILERLARGVGPLHRVPADDV